MSARCRRLSIESDISLSSLLNELDREEYGIACGSHAANNDDSLPELAASFMTGSSEGSTPAEPAEAPAAPSGAAAPKTIYRRRHEPRHRRPSVNDALAGILFKERCRYSRRSGEDGAAGGAIASSPHAFGPVAYLRDSLQLSIRRLMHRDGGDTITAVSSTKPDTDNRKYESTISDKYHERAFFERGNDETGRSRAVGFSQSMEVYTFEE